MLSKHLPLEGLACALVFLSLLSSTVKDTKVTYRQQETPSIQNIVSLSGNFSYVILNVEAVRSQTFRSYETMYAFLIKLFNYKKKPQQIPIYILTGWCIYL